MKIQFHFTIQTKRSSAKLFEEHFQSKRLVQVRKLKLQAGIATN